ncbi:MAG: hypothetical protein ACXWJ4_04260 [Methyloceanibacter sp.]
MPSFWAVGSWQLRVRADVPDVRAQGQVHEFRVTPRTLTGIEAGS